MTKRRILVLADTPTCATGFAQVSRNVLRELYETGEFLIDMIGINYDGVFNRDEFMESYPYLNTLVPALKNGTSDVYGREYALRVLSGAVPELQPTWDIFFTIQDHFIIEAKSTSTGQSFAESIRQMQRNTLMSKYKENNFMWVGYYPVDGDLKQNWVDDAIAKTNFPVAYCEYGKQQILAHASKENDVESRLSVIRHGTNTTDFFPIEGEKRDKLREEYFGKLGITKDTYLIINVNRNQIRKDLLRTLLVYKEFKQKVPNAFLYLHCNAYNDQGGNLFDMAKAIGLNEKDFAVPKVFSEQHGVPIKVVNELFNCADAVLTTTLGEGWGLSITEAMATKTPVFAPNITSIPEILGTENGFDPETSRGITFEAGVTYSELVCYGAQDNERVRPITNVDDAVSKMLWAYENKDKVKEIVERAYQWASALTWKAENEKWMAVFREAIKVNDRLRKQGIGTVELGRNDMCPVCLTEGVTKKIKKCEKHREAYLVK